MPDWQDAAILAFVSHDLFWITRTPSLGVPAVLACVGLQAGITVSRIQAGGFGLANEFAVLIWLLGGVTWTCSEFLWDGHAPAGFLKDSRALVGLDKAYYYPITMTLAVVLMAAGAVALVVIHLTRWALFVRQERKKAVQAEVLTRPLMQCDPPLTEASTEIPGPVRCLPLPIYAELFLLPWIFMDTSWALANVLDLWKIPQPAGLFWFTSFVGYAAIIIQADCIRRMWAAKQRRDAIIGAAEWLWVAGNIVWLTEDMLTDDNCTPAKHAAAGIFAFGVLLGCLGMLHSSDDDDDDNLEDLESSGGLVQATIITSVDVNDIALRLSATPPLKPAAAKKQHRSSRSKKTQKQQEASLIVLPEGEGGQELAKDDLRRAAAIAIREAHGTNEVFALFNLAHVRRQLVEWHARFPCARPYYALGQPNSHVARVALEGGSGLSCATPAEISLALSLGASPDDLLFSEPIKPRSHLRFAASNGVRLMTFYDDAELRKIAAECPGAQLLLSIVADEDGHGAVRFGASRAEWPKLIKSAAALGVRIAGVSLRSGPCGSGGGATLRPALAAVRDLLAAVPDADVLDLGAMLPSGAADDETLAGILRHWPKLRLLAECNAGLCEGAASLLTRIAGRWGSDYVLGGGRFELLREVMGASGGGWHTEALVVSGSGKQQRRLHVAERTGGWAALPGNPAELPELSDGDWLLWRQVGDGQTCGLDLVDLASKGEGLRLCYYRSSGEGKGSESAGY